MFSTRAPLDLARNRLTVMHERLRAGVQLHVHVLEVGQEGGVLADLVAQACIPEQRAFGVADDPARIDNADGLAVITRLK